jgi:signal transduction histidine kinase
VSSRARELAALAVERRVLRDLEAASEAPSLRRRPAVLAAAAVLFAVTFAARLAVEDPNALIANFYTVPIALVAIELGLRAGLLAAAVAFGLVFAWGAIETVHVGTLGYVSRGAAFLLTGGVVGRNAEQMRQDISARRRAQRQLAGYADELERSNDHLAQSNARLEAFARIARTVGGETDLERVLLLILEQGREIVGARGLLICVPDAHELAVVAGSALAENAPTRLPRGDSLVGQVFDTGRARLVTDDEQAEQLDRLSPGARAAILVPLTFRGETLGVLAGIDHVDGRPFEPEDEQLLASVAASAATAVATARTVAADRLRLSIEAAEQARGRWARELHDETLQGLGGVRMLLSAAIDQDDLGALRRAAATADEHLAAELRRLRDLIAELRPAALDDLGLGPAIETLAERQSAAGGFTVSAAIDLAGGERLPRETEGAIYRVVQEALTNAAKHAGARHVAVAVTGRANRIEIRVEDDGCGFDPAGIHTGFGLTGMRERAMLAGGRLTVESEPGGPTRITAVLPGPRDTPPMGQMADADAARPP